MATKTGGKRDNFRIFTFLLVLDTCIFTATDQTVIWETNTDKDGTPALHLLRETTWWDAAGAGCGGAGSHLYLPGVDVSREVIHLLQEDTPYWIGAVENSKWIWTADETPLYTSIGYSAVPLDPDTIITGNSAFKCHLHCYQEDSHVFGLRGDECYCLGSNTDVINNEDDLKRCSGNYEEFCGNEEGISIYKAGVSNLVPDESGECGYAERTGNTIRVMQDDGCDARRFLACSKPVTQPWKCKANICTQHKKRSWYQSSEYCDLLKVTTGNVNQMKSIMIKSNNRRPFTYWVGLERRFSRRWINGSVVHGDYEHLDDEEACLSLAISRTVKSSSTVTFSWRPCGERYEAICQKVVPFSTTVPQIPDAGQTTIIPGEGGSSNMTSPDEITDVNESDNTGAYVGVTITIILITGVGIVTVLFLKRKEKFCFSRTKKEKSDFHTMSLNYDSNYYSAPASIKRNTTQFGRQPSIQDTYSRPDENYYSEPSEVISSRTNRDEHIYVNDPKLSTLQSYNKIHDIPRRPTADGYDHVELQNPTVGLENSFVDNQRPKNNLRSPKDASTDALDDHLYLVLENENGIPSGKSLVDVEASLEPSRASPGGVKAGSGHSQVNSGHPSGSLNYSETFGEDPVYEVTDSGEGDSAILPQDYSLASEVQQPQEGRVGYYSPLKFDKPDENVYSHIDGEESGSRHLSEQTGQNRVDTKCYTDTEYLVPEEHLHSSDIVDNVYSLAEEASFA